MLRCWYETKLQEVCREENSQDPTRFTDRVMFASLMYFKRFFLRASLMEEDPKHVMLAALLVAGKVEEERIEPDDLLPKYAKIKLETLLALELRVLEALSFQLVTISPFRALQGFLQDLQSECGGGMHDLQQLHTLACDFIRRSLCADAPFLFTPQQLALAGLCEAGVAALLAPLAAHTRLQTVDLSSNIRRRMLPWMDAAVDELGPALVALLTRCERLR